MDFFRSILLAALFAGITAGTALTGLQTLKVFPLVFTAEEIENSGGVDKHVHTSDSSTGEEEWMPSDGLERLFYSFLSNVLISVGLGLALAAIMAVRRVTDWRQGVIWGLCGFIVVNLAPALGMPPELPGMPAGDLVERQTWWWATAFLTASGLALIFLVKGQISGIAGVVAMALPHIYGAPQSIDNTSIIPAYLAAEFATASLSTNLVFWALLGALSALAIAHQLSDDPDRAT